MIPPTLLDAPAAPAAPAAAVKSASAARRALLFFLSHQDTYRRPLFSPQEIFCGPDTDNRTAPRRVLALRTDAGDFDVAAVLAKLPREQLPEFVVVKADATGRNLPRNLAAVKGPRVLLVGDTHHLGQPLRRLIRYAQQEPFDFVIFDHTRHHARFFAEAGLRNLHWLPALDYGFVQREPRPAPAHPLTFVGQVGKHHPYRCEVLAQVRAAGLPLEVLQGKLTDTADLYADSQVTLNISLNGDLNLRVFEALAAGGCLLTDELSPESGFSRLFEAGKHLDTWRTPGELIEKTRHYLAHPAEAWRLRREGQAEVLRNHHPTVKLREFYALLDSGAVNPRYDLTQEAWWPRGATVVSPGLPKKLAAYETLQELHRTSRDVTIFAETPAVLAEFANLPRLRVAPLAELCAPAESEGLPHRHILLWEESTPAETLLRFGGDHVLVASSEAAARPELDALGFTAPADGSPLFTLTQPMLLLQRAWNEGGRDAVRARLAPLIAGAHRSSDCVTLANYAEQLGDSSLQSAALQRAIALDRDNQVALLALAALLLEQDETASTALVLEEAGRVGALPPAVDELRRDLTARLGEQADMLTYLRTVGRGPVTRATNPRRIVLVTNLFPPQELGGYGRMMWEFAHGLRARGHTVHVITADVPNLAKPATPEEVELEKYVDRSLALLGSWDGGRPQPVTDAIELSRRTKANAKLVRTAIHHTHADVVLIGNLDFLGVSPVQAALDLGKPVLHALANAAPGYSTAEQPDDPRYWVAPCSHWNGSALRQGGYLPARVETLYPGARIDRFFRFMLPDTARLRLCYASLVLPYKGAHLLVQALDQLHSAGVDFTAEIAGDAPDAAFLGKLRDFVRERGLDDKVSFTGFLDRPGLAALFARSNVLVFPSQFPEPFGISQVEAMAAGLVVVTSGTGGAREIVQHGKDGLVFEAGNAGDLARKLFSLTGDQESFSVLQCAVQRRAVEFSTEAAVQRIEKLFDEMPK